MLFSPACERNKGPILAVLKEWLPAHAQVLEIGSGSGQHAAFFCQQIPGLTWQTSERQESLLDLQAQLEVLSPTLPPAIALNVTEAGQWPRQGFDAVFSANTCHIMSAAAVPLGTRRTKTTRASFRVFERTDLFNARRFTSLQNELCDAVTFFD